MTERQDVTKFEAAAEGLVNPDQRCVVQSKESQQVTLFSWLPLLSVQLYELVLVFSFASVRSRSLSVHWICLAGNVYFGVNRQTLISSVT